MMFPLKPGNGAAAGATLKGNLMHQLPKHFSTTLACALVFAATGAQAQSPQPEMGRWITQSGNLEVDIAPCGMAVCGTVVRVIANRAMAGRAMPAAAASPIGKRILFDLKAVPGGGFQGRIFNRADNKTYNSQLAAESPDQLKLTIYDDNPAKGQVQIWQRAGMAD